MPARLRAAQVRAGGASYRARGLHRDGRSYPGSARSADGADRGDAAGLDAGPGGGGAADDARRLETARPDCYDAVAIARAAGFRVLVMSPHPSCGDCPLTARSRPKRAAKISRKIVAGQQYLSGWWKR